jgi:KipI family sensor histidine kinase inhibitor
MPARFLAAGDTAMTIEFGSTADQTHALRCVALRMRILALELPGIVEVLATIRSVTIHYDPCLTSAAALKCQLLPIVDELESGSCNSPPQQSSLQPRRWEIPACYEHEHGIDIDEVGWTCGLHPEDIARLHSAETYRVLMVGFLPGQPYLGDLPAPLRVPRRASPRISVAAGSIAIATTMSVIYPQASPGGWHIIARTPIPLFDVNRAAPSLLSAGDEVRFTPITSKEFEALAAKSAAGQHQFQPLEAAA